MKFISLIPIILLIALLVFVFMMIGRLPNPTGHDRYTVARVLMNGPIEYFSADVNLQSKKYTVCTSKKKHKQGEWDGLDCFEFEGKLGRWIQTRDGE